jgi:FMN-dependent oxidoreductase (nitrilotriacetate monooxygenase family)
MEKRKEQMRLGVFLLTGGHHAAAWRLPETPVFNRVEDYINVAKIAERAKLDMLFFADTVSSRLANMKAASRSANNFAAQMFEPLTLLSVLSQHTKYIGLTATASTMYYEPYNLARLFNSLDLISGGRAGWNIVTTAEEEAAQNFGKEWLEHDDRYKVAEEFVEVVRGLWDSWEDDAFVRDRQSGQYFDPAKVHYLNHEGKYFKSRGPMNLPRSPQGQPVLVQAGSSGVGKDLAARVGEVVFTAQHTLGDRQTFYKDLKARAKGFGRDPGDVLIMPGVSPIVANSASEGKAKLARINALIDAETALSTLGAFMVNVDLRKFALDEPLPEIPETKGNQSRQALALQMARRENMTLRELALWFAGTRGHWMPIGTAAEIADQMEECFDAYGCDGYNIMPVAFPGVFEDFCTQVVPELQRRGRFRKDYEGTTLRDHLGLKRPAFNRHRQPAAAQ